MWAKLQIFQKCVCARTPVLQQFNYCNGESGTCGLVGVLAGWAAGTGLQPTAAGLEQSGVSPFCPYIYISFSDCTVDLCQEGKGKT